MSILGGVCGGKGKVSLVLISEQYRQRGLLTGIIGTEGSKRKNEKSGRRRRRRPSNRFVDEASGRRGGRLELAYFATMTSDHGSPSGASHGQSCSALSTLDRPRREYREA